MGGEHNGMTYDSSDEEGSVMRVDYLAYDRTYDRTYDSSVMRVDYLATQ